MIFAYKNCEMPGRELRAQGTTRNKLKCHSMARSLSSQKHND